MPIAPNLRLVIANSNVRHQHAGGEYNERRASCEEGVRLLQPHLGPIKALRDVKPADLEHFRRALPERVYRRCRHIVSENARVLEAERALKAANFAACGRAMNELQMSMRDDFEITCPEIDFLADIAQGVEGVYGSRMTGGGFGGCTVSLVEADAVERLGDARRRLPRRLRPPRRHLRLHAVRRGGVRRSRGRTMSLVGLHMTNPAFAATSHRRLNPLTGEWVLVSPHRTQAAVAGQARGGAGDDRAGLRSRLLSLRRQRARQRRAQPRLFRDLRVRQRLSGADPRCASRAPGRRPYRRRGRNRESAGSCASRRATT